MVLKILDFADYRTSQGRALSRIAVVYGPLYSRRRGPSLGINMFPGPSVCSFNCTYCFRGGAQLHLPALAQGEVGAPGPRDVVRALRKALELLGPESEAVRAIDFSGNGEPTLHPLFPDAVKAVRRFIDETGLGASLGLFTNSTRLCSPRVREALAYLDHVEAKLDTVVEWKFRAINQPARGIELSEIIDCLRVVKGFIHGELALQVILLDSEGVANYECSDAEALAEIAAEIEPDLVNLYTVYAPPRRRLVEKAPRSVMECYAQVLREHGLRVRVFAE